MNKIWEDSSKKESNIREEFNNKEGIDLLLQMMMMTMYVGSFDLSSISDLRKQSI